MIKQAFKLAIATIGLASAQSWSDFAGASDCKDVDPQSKFKEEVAALTYYPTKDRIKIDDLSLEEMVFLHKKEGEEAQCFYFTTQVLPGQDSKKIEYYCNEQKTKPETLKFETRVPLWNIQNVTSNYIGTTMVDITFLMMYDNTTDPAGYYRYTEDKDGNDVNKQLIDDAIANGNLNATANRYEKLMFLLQEKVKAKPEEFVALLQQLGVTQDVASLTPENLANIDATKLIQTAISEPLVMKLFFNMTTLNHETKNVELVTSKFIGDNADTPAKPGCQLDVLPGSTIKGAKFKLDLENKENLLDYISFRVQPKQDYYDTVHTYVQNGDIYSVGYDNDFYDGKVEYTANGYPPQSFSWKLSRSYSTSVVASAMTIVGALIGSYAF